jgi:hypothetical protein
LAKNKTLAKDSTLVYWIGKSIGGVAQLVDAHDVTCTLKLKKYPGLKIG